MNGESATARRLKGARITAHASGDTASDCAPRKRLKTMCNQRQLSNDELAVLMSVHAGMSPAQYQAITETQLTVDPENPDELSVLAWSQSDRLQFLLAAARTYGRPN